MTEKEKKDTEMKRKRERQRDRQTMERQVCSGDGETDRE